MKNSFLRTISKLSLAIMFSIRMFRVFEVLGKLQYFHIKDLYFTHNNEQNAWCSMGCYSKRVYISIYLSSNLDINNFKETNFSIKGKGMNHPAFFKSTVELQYITFRYFA